MAWAIKQRAGGPAAKIVLLCLANYADDKNQTFASQNLIAEQAEVSLRTARDSIKILEVSNLLRREQRRRKDGTRTTDLFTLPVPAAESAGSQPSTGRICRINRQILPGKRDEPITYPITKEIDEDRKKKLEALRQSLAATISASNVPRRGRLKLTAA